MMRLSAYVAALFAVLLLLPITGWAAYQAYVGKVPQIAIALPDTIPGQQQDPADLMDLPSKPIEDYAETIARPLFFEGRAYPARSTAPVAPTALRAAPKQVVTIDGIKLLGIISGSGGSRALFDEPTKAALLLKPGQQIQSWTIESIDNNSVTLMRDGQQQTLLLYKSSTDK